MIKLTEDDKDWRATGKLTQLGNRPTRVGLLMHEMKLNPERKTK